MPTYPRAPVEFVAGAGSLLRDSDGREYLDLFSGLSVHNAGHCNPRIVAAIAEQAATLGGTSNLFYSEPAMRLTERLVDSSLGGRAFLCNSGAEANECAIKLVRRRAHGRGIDRPEIVVLDHAFHGRTLAALAATPRLARDDLFGPLPGGFVGRPPRRSGRARSGGRARDRGGDDRADPGRVGRPPDRRRRPRCRPRGLRRRPARCSSSTRSRPGWAGPERSGRTSAPGAPDVMTTAKALGGGLPVGACVTAPARRRGADARRARLDLRRRADLRSRGAGGTRDPRSARKLLADVAEREAQVREAARRHPAVAGVRGRGLMIGVGLAAGVDAAVAAAALARGVVVNAPNPETIRLLPPLTIEAGELAAGLSRLRESLDAASG